MDWMNLYVLCASFVDLLSYLVLLSVKHSDFRYINNLFHLMQRIPIGISLSSIQRDEVFQP